MLFCVFYLHLYEHKNLQYWIKMWIILFKCLIKFWDLICFGLKYHVSLQKGYEKITLNDGWAFRTNTHKLFQVESHAVFIYLNSGSCRVTWVFCFCLFASKFWEVATTYKWFDLFIYLSLSVLLVTTSSLWQRSGSQVVDYEKVVTPWSPMACLPR